MNAPTPPVRKTPPKVSKASVARPKPPVVPLPPVHLPPGHMSTLGFNQCRFIAGDPKDGICCGERTRIGIPWCADHELVCFVKSKTRGVAPTGGADMRIR